jgi:hypothetical protein
MAIQHTRDTDRGKGAARKRWTAQPMGQELDALVGSFDSALLQRAVMDPRVASPADILALQRSFGNEAVSGLIQAKLTVGPAGDQYEQEADRVAQQVMSVPAPGSRPRSAVRGQPGVQRQEMEEEEELQMKRVAGQPLVQRFVAQRQAPEEEEELQLKAVQRQPPDQEGALMRIPLQRVGPEGGPVPEEVKSAINRARGAGQSLDGPVQEQMSARMGHNFSGVRVHTDAEADVLNQQLSARAFTTGQDIFFRQGEYNPGSSSGRELIAHELTHVVQQRTGMVGAEPSGMAVRPVGDAFEQEADDTGREANHEVTNRSRQRATSKPGWPSPADVEALQHTMANREVKRLLVQRIKEDEKETDDRAQKQQEESSIGRLAGDVKEQRSDGLASNARQSETEAGSRMANKSVGQNKPAGHDPREGVSEAGLTLAVLQRALWENEETTFRTENTTNDMGNSAYKVSAHDYSRFAPVNFKRDMSQVLFQKQPRSFAYDQGRISGNFDPIAYVQAGAYETAMFTVSGDDITLRVTARGEEAVEKLSRKSAKDDEVVDLPPDAIKEDGQLKAKAGFHLGHAVRDKGAPHPEDIESNGFKQWVDYMVVTLEEEERPEAREESYRSIKATWSGGAK